MSSQESDTTERDAACRQARLAGKRGGARGEELWAGEGRALRGANAEGGRAAGTVGLPLTKGTQG